jgi:hypothetical protein
MVSGTSSQNPDFGISQNSQNPGHGDEVGRVCALQPRDENVKEKYQVSTQFTDGFCAESNIIRTPITSVLDSTVRSLHYLDVF